MFLPQTPSTVSVRQLANDSGSVTRGLREGKSYVLTINGEPLAELTPIRRRRFVSRTEFADMSRNSPMIDLEAFRADQDAALDHSVSSAYER